MVIIKYLFSSPKGDISLRPEDLARPFLITPAERHPFLTLGDYFKAVREFILKDQRKHLARALKERLNREIDPDNIREILIRSEKHGALYHLASVEIFAGNRQTKFAVSTALSAKGRRCLTREYELLRFLNSSRKLPYLPKAHLKGEVKCRTVKKKHERLSMLLSEWFEDYHEWHLSLDNNDNNQKVCIWGFGEGNRYASKEEAFEIFRQISQILTLYYDPKDFNQIYPWHHAAGDFIVRIRGKEVDLRLTTVREYQSIMGYFSGETADPMIAIVYFFLNLTVRMQLDKLDGVGETVWAGDFYLNAITRGFFDAVRIMGVEGRYPMGRAGDLLSLLKSFGEEEIRNLLHPLGEWYRQGDPAEFRVIEAHLKSHVNLLYHALQDFRL